MPRFKILIDLVDFSVVLCRKREVIKAVSQFNIFLGSVNPEHKSNLSFWQVVMATDDLQRVPKKLELVVGGLEFEVEVRPVTWEIGPIYKAYDFPKEPQKYVAPPPTEPTLDLSPDTLSLDLGSKGTYDGGDDMMHYSRRVLLEVCSSLDLKVILLKLRHEKLGGSSCCPQGHGVICKRSAIPT